MSDVLIHPRLLGTLGQHYGTRITLEAFISVQDPDSGEEIADWGPLPGWQSRRASIVPISATESAQAGSDLETVRLRVYLHGYCPEAARGIRVHDLETDRSATVEGVQHDSRRLMTVLLTEDFAL